MAENNTPTQNGFLLVELTDAFIRTPGADLRIISLHEGENTMLQLAKHRRVLAVVLGPEGAQRFVGAVLRSHAAALLAAQLDGILVGENMRKWAVDVMEHYGMTATSVDVTV